MALIQNDKRKWTYISVKAQFEEKPPENVWPELSEDEVQSHRDSVQPDWEMLLYVLPQPLIVEMGITNIFKLEHNGLRCRIYPPFPLNYKDEAAGLFTDIKIPEGENQVQSERSIPSSAVRGLVANLAGGNNLNYCQGLRLDVENHFPSDIFFKKIVDQLTQYTQQWWLRLSHSPSTGPLKFSAPIDKSFRVLEELRYRGAGKVEGTWRSIESVQSLIGIEKPLTSALWKNCLDNIQLNIPAEVGILSLTDALSHYMAHEDERCVLSLAICFEVLANKQHFSEKGKYESSVDKLRRKTPLIDGKHQDAIKYLFVDRDHVAHGRALYIASKRHDMTIETYIEAITNVVNNYLQRLKPDDWAKFSKLSLDSTRRYK